MTFRKILKKIQSSQVFQNFRKQHPSAELCAGFFILDFSGNENKQALDYKTEDMIFTFDLKDDKIIMKEDQILDMPTAPKLTKINPKTRIETDELKSIAGTRALDEGISAKFQKIIAVLQNHEGRQVWNLTCIMENLIVLHILIDSETGDVIKFERKSFMDFIKKAK